MSRKLRIIISCVLVVFAFGAGIFAYAQTQGKTGDANAETVPANYFVGSDGKIAVPSGEMTKEARNNRGTEDNPFFILEIVPYDGMAEIGYLISGQEPIDVDAAARDGLHVPGQDLLYELPEGATFKFWASEQPSTFSPTGTGQTNQYGTMTLVNDGSGQYTRSDEVMVDGHVASATYTPAVNGNFKWEPLEIDECLSLETEERASERSMYETAYQDADTPGDSFKMFFADVNYVTGSGNKLTHKNDFLRESIGLAYDYDEDGKRHAVTDEDEIKRRIEEYNTVVYTVTPEDLNLNPELVKRADLIFISSMAEMVPNDVGTTSGGMYVEVIPGEDPTLNKYRYIPYIKKNVIGYQDPTGTFGRKENKPGASYTTNPLDWEIILLMYERATNPEFVCPIVVDFKIYDQTKTDNTKSVHLKKRFADGTYAEGAAKAGTQNNLTKLFLMMYHMENPLFEAFYGEVTGTNHPMFEARTMYDASDNPMRKKDGTDLTTGAFLYDKDWPAADQSTEDESRTYWNELTLLPWSVMPDSTGHDNVATYGSIMATYMVMVHSGDAYNMTSGYAQNSIRNSFMAFNGDTKLGTGFNTLDCDVSDTERQYSATLYEFFDEIRAPGDPVEPYLTMADCLHYLLGGLRGNSNMNKKFKVLELQPSPLYENESSFWKPLIAAYTGSVVPPEIVPMTTSEFIGSNVECISEYDLIYVGMKKDFSDPTMDFSTGYEVNFVYAHSGPKKTVPNGYKALYGWLGTIDEGEEKHFIYSGNDLTNLALTKLREYDEAGFPILFGNGFFTDMAATTLHETIDRNSNVYVLGDETVHKFNVSALGTSVSKAQQLKKMLTINSNKVTMVFASASDSPVLYDSTKPLEQDRYINGYSQSYRTLRYKFKVDAPVGTSYEVKMYVDTNTDGNFEEGLEDIGALVYGTDASGNEAGQVPSGMVEAGKTYIVKRTVNDRIGSLSWKLDLVKDNKAYASLSGVSAIKADINGSEDENICVLQILPNAYTPTLLLPRDEADAAAIGGSSQMFYEKIQNINGMNITFVRMTQAEVLEKINGNAEFAPEPDYLYDTYDMLVLGFADCYDGVSNTTVIEKIQEFIDYGKAVLYTHDTSSFIGPTGGSFNSWGKTITETCRDLFGMDRYGAVNYLKNSNYLATKDVPYLPSKATRDLSSLYKNSSGVRLLQGMTNGILWRCFYPSEPGDTDANVNATKVSRVNKGAITEYPYTIPEGIDTESTHPQYYQLDMEEEDMVVWYCLDGGTGGMGYENTYFGATKNDVRNNYYIYNKGNITYSGMGHKLNNGTVELKEKEIELFVNTFVAAYRAAAKPVKVKVTNQDANSDSAGDQYLTVTVDSSELDEVFGTDIVDTYRLQVPNGTGYLEGAEETKTSKRVYFKLLDNNSYTGTYDLKIELNDGAEIDGVQIDGVSKMLAVYEKATDRFVNAQTVKFKANTDEYYVDIPIRIDTEIKNGVARRVVGITKAKITVTMNYRIGERDFSVSGDTMVYISPCGLFNLD